MIDLAEILIALDIRMWIVSGIIGLIIVFALYVTDKEGLV